MKNDDLILLKMYFIHPDTSGLKMKFSEGFRAVCKITILIILLFYVINSDLYSQFSEYKLKSIMIEKISRFIEWPANTGVADSSKPFIISVIGESQFGKELQDIYSSRTILNKKVEIRYIVNIGDISGSHILFISSSKSDELGAILSYARTQPILIIGDTSDYAKRGVHINFYQENKKIRFEINDIDLKKSGLKASYHLLSLGKIIKAN